MKKHEEEREENLFFASKSDDSTKSNEWYVDGGCNNHMTGDERLFCQLIITILEVLIASKSNIPSLLK